MCDGEISSETISKYINGIHTLSVVTGKIDFLLLYAEQTYSQDKFLIHSLSSILKNIVMVNQDNKYERTQIHIDDKPICSTKYDILSKEGALNVKKVQIPHEDIKTLPKDAEIAQDENLDIKGIAFDTHYILVNSTHLEEFWYSSGASLLKTKFKDNQRLYHYISVPKFHIDKMILLDTNGESASKYFNTEVKCIYEYREVSGEAEEMVG